ncbi:hypothetical protein IJH16_03415 [Candidatus Saccharibacteria bacterium]|nr:hypothetical protein [Candidatus Saccharibacteria bacterium]
MNNVSVGMSKFLIVARLFLITSFILLFAFATAIKKPHAKPVNIPTDILSSISYFADFSKVLSSQSEESIAETPDVPITSTPENEEKVEDQSENSKDSTVKAESVEPNTAQTTYSSNYSKNRTSTSTAASSSSKSTSSYDPNAIYVDDRGEAIDSPIVIPITNNGNASENSQPTPDPSTEEQPSTTEGSKGTESSKDTE